MRIIFIGQEAMIHRLTAILDEEGNEVVLVSGKFRELVAMWEQAAFDIAIVDSLTEDFEAVCYHINEAWAIPFVLVIDTKQADWKRLRSLYPDGYLPREAADTEIRAHLRAAIRRLSVSTKDVNLSSVHHIEK